MSFMDKAKNAARNIDKGKFHEAVDKAQEKIGNDRLNEKVDGLQEKLGHTGERRAQDDGSQTDESQDGVGGAHSPRDRRSDDPESG